MNTYADMVTLLLCFFVLLFSMSTVDAEKWEALVKSFINEGDETSQIVISPDGEGNEQGVNQGVQDGKADADSPEVSGTPLPEDFDDLYQYMKEYVEQQGMEDTVEVTKGEGSVYIRFSDNIFFGPDKYDLREDSIKLLDFLGDGLVAVADEIKAVNINGHTAMVPGVTEYPVSDRRLSGERAASVAIYLEEEKGFDPAKMIASGFGGLHPVADNNTAEGRSKNRRVDMLIISNESTTAGEQLMEQMLTGTYNTENYPASGNVTDALLNGGTGIPAGPKEPARPDFVVDDGTQTAEEQNAVPVPAPDAEDTGEEPAPAAPTEES